MQRYEACAKGAVHVSLGIWKQIQTLKSIKNVVLILILESLIAGADWTDEEVNLVKAELWAIMTNPYKFVKKHKKAKKEKCGKACWEDCDAFDKGKKINIT